MGAGHVDSPKEPDETARCSTERHCPKRDYLQRRIGINAASRRSIDGCIILPSGPPMLGKGGLSVT